MVYNVPVLSGIYFNSQAGKETEALISWAAAAILYPLNVNKIYYQVAACEISSLPGRKDRATTISQGYRGVIPYLLINAAIGWSLRPLFSKEKLAELREEVDHEKD